MATSEAKIRANRENPRRHAAGPTSSSGKSRSRRNSLKHGLTGEGIVLSDEDQAEVDRRFAKLTAVREKGTGNPLLFIEISNGP